MESKKLCAFFIVVCVFLFTPIFYVYGVGADGEEEIKTGEKELKELHKRLNKKKDKDVDIYYRKEIITKEPKKEEYLEYLLVELKKSLEKGKKWGKIRRVEGKLVEIDKGSVHKVRERDVYIVYDSSMNYKGKVEIEAIADAISIGELYETKIKIEPGDTIKFRGQRRRLEIGLINGFSDYYKDVRYLGFGMIWKYNLRGGLGFESVITDFSRFKRESIYSEGMREDKEEREHINYTVGIRKYFYYPARISPYLGLGGSYITGVYKYAIHYYIFNNGNPDKNIQKDILKICPYYLLGIQLIPTEQLHIELDVRYFYGPRLNVEPEPIKIRPIIYCSSVSFTW
ncbi:MAG: hypothetical protein PHE88_05280 [Elusimicrobia bacterium]|nr:hypothetical protein [Elusimicrobiota bacterium]